MLRPDVHFGHPRPAPIPLLLLWLFAILWIVFLLIAASRPSNSAILCVDRNCAGTSHDGAGWGTAFLTISEALVAASPDDEIWVAKGDYAEALSLTKNVALYGGFAGSETARDARVAKDHPVVVTGSGTLPCVIALGTPAPTHVIIDGFTIRNATPGSGGITCADPGLNLTIANCIVTGHQGVRVSGIVAEGDSVTVANCDIEDNICQPDGSGAPSLGGGIVCLGRNITITSNTIRDNGASMGGGIWVPSAETVNITSNLLTWNAGGGVYCGSPIVDDTTVATAVIASNVLADNYADRSGPVAGGITCQGVGWAFINRNEVLRNRGAAGGVATSSTDAVVFANVMEENVAIATTDGTAQMPGTGGGFLNNGIGTTLLTSNLFAHNTAQDSSAGLDGKGGGVYVKNARLIDNTIADNQAAQGGGLYCGGGLILLSNTIVAFNSSGITNDSTVPSKVMVRYCDVYGNGADDYQGFADPTGEDGNIREDPAFAARATLDYHLLAGSPCTDAGYDDDIRLFEPWIKGYKVDWPLSWDCDGKVRIMGAHVDIGAYESGTRPLYTQAEAVAVLQVCGSMATSSVRDMFRLNVSKCHETDYSGKSYETIDILDAVRIARKDGGFDTNPG